MKVKKVSLISIALVFAMAAIMTAPAYANMVWDFDSDTGEYIYIEAAAGGNFYRGKLYSPSAYVFAYILKDLPDDYVLVVYWCFSWVDENYVIHQQFDTEDFPGYRYKGQSVKIKAEGFPSVVILIWTEGRAGYDGVWDTRKVLAGVPLTPA